MHTGCQIVLVVVKFFNLGVICKIWLRIDLALSKIITFRLVYACRIPDINLAMELLRQTQEDDRSLIDDGLDN